MKLLSGLILMALILASCTMVGCTTSGSAVEEPSFYLLRADARVPDEAQPAPVSIGIGRVSIADYLAQAGIVVATGGDRVRPAHLHLWAEPLDSAIRLFLRDAISAEAGYLISADTARRRSWDYRLDIRIDEWHGSLAGDVRIRAAWIVIDMTNDHEVASHRFERSAMLTDDGYEALVTTQKRLLTGLAGAIAASLVDLDD